MCGTAYIAKGSTARIGELLARLAFWVALAVRATQKGTGDTKGDGGIFKWSEFPELLTRPEEIIRHLVDFLGITPTPDEIRSAIEHVNPSLRKFG